MSCNPLTSATCIAQIAASAASHAAGNVAGGVTSAAVGGLAGAIQDGIAQIATGMVAWWTKLPSPDLATDPVPHVIQAWLFPFTAAVALISIITAAARMILTRKATPLVDVGSGLLTIAVASAAGTLLPALLLKAGDAFSGYVLNASTGGQFSHRFVTLLSLGGTVSQAGTAAILIVVGVLALAMAAVQAIVLLFRLGAVIILAGVLPLAAAGTMTSLTRPWFKRVTGWMLALIFYKPAAALVYATGFLLIGQGTLPQDALMGFAVLLLSLVALPALMRFFTWTTGQVEANSSGGVLSAVIGGAAAVGALRGYGGMSAGDQARAMTGALGAGPSGGGEPGAAPGPGSSPPAGNGGGSPGTGRNPPAGGASSASSPAAGSAAAGAAVSTGGGAPAGTAAAAAGAAAGASPAGLITLGGEVARGAAMRLADGAAPPGDQP